MATYRDRLATLVTAVDEAAPLFRPTHLIRRTVRVALVAVVLTIAYAVFVDSEGCIPLNPEAASRSPDDRSGVDIRVKVDGHAVANAQILMKPDTEGTYDLVDLFAQAGLLMSFLKFDLVIVDGELLRLVHDAQRVMWVRVRTGLAGFCPPAIEGFAFKVTFRIVVINAQPAVILIGVEDDAVLSAHVQGNLLAVCILADEHVRAVAALLDDLAANLDVRESGRQFIGGCCS